MPNCACCFLSAGGPAIGHESWISKGKFKNAANEWCCGDIDCVVIPESRVYPNGVRYDLVLDRTETVPNPEALASQAASIALPSLGWLLPLILRAAAQHVTHQAFQRSSARKCAVLRDVPR
jgi:hypothetical protein